AVGGEPASCWRKSYAAGLSAGWQNTSVTRPAGDRAARRAIPTSRRVRLSSPNSACPNDSIAHARSLFMHAKPSTLDRNSRGRIDLRSMVSPACAAGSVDGRPSLRTLPAPAHSSTARGPPGAPHAPAPVEKKPTEDATGATLGGGGGGLFSKSGSSSNLWAV